MEVGIEPGSSEELPVPRTAESSPQPLPFCLSVSDLYE